MHISKKKSNLMKKPITAASVAPGMSSLKQHKTSEMYLEQNNTCFLPLLSTYMQKEPAKLEMPLARNKPRDWRAG